MQLKYKLKCSQEMVLDCPGMIKTETLPSGSDREIPALFCQEWSLTAGE